MTKGFSMPPKIEFELLPQFLKDLLRNRSCSWNFDARTGDCQTAHMGSSLSRFNAHTSDFDPHHMVQARCCIRCAQRVKFHPSVHMVCTSDRTVSLGALFPCIVKKEITELFWC